LRAGFGFNAGPQGNQNLQQLQGGSGNLGFPQASQGGQGSFPPQSLAQEVVSPGMPLGVAGKAMETNAMSRTTTSGKVDRTTGLEETPTKEDLDPTQRTRLASLA
jgi:hypothetical protein